ncbi:MAG: methyltransferase domain-containing protein [Acidobacteriota bacterium]
MPLDSRSPWSTPETVSGFVRSPPNAMLVQFAAAELARVGRGCAVDIGCGAGRNAVPLVSQGWKIVGIDSSWPMLRAAAERAARERLADRLLLSLSAMDGLGVRDRACDLVVAHGIWNLARSAAELRRAIDEAARISKPGAGLFVFTFSRSTLPVQSEPVAGESFVFTEFSGVPQCFLTASQLLAELGRVGFEPTPEVPLREYNRPAPGSVRHGAPAIYEAAFRRRIPA